MRADELELLHSDRMTYYFNPLKRSKLTDDTYDLSLVR